MRRLILTSIFILILFIGGCGKNPTEPLPPIQPQAPTFEDHLARLKTPGHTYFWVNQFMQYDMNGQLGWNWIERDMPDLAYSLAYSVWETYIKGHNAGVCGQFAATYVVAARIHGYESGFMITYSWNSDGTNIVGHARAWIIKDGKVITTDNEYMNYTNYKDKEDFFQKFGECWFYNEYSSGWITNDKLEVIYDINGCYDNPKNILIMTEEQKDILSKCLGYIEGTL